MGEEILKAIQELNNRCYAVELRERLARNLGRHVSYGRLYMELDRLEEEGKIASWQEEGTPERGDRPRKFYKVLPHILA